MVCVAYFVCFAAIAFGSARAATLIVNAHGEQQRANASRNDWPWTPSQCTGNNDPPANAPFCYSGSKMGETVTVRVNSYNKSAAHGSIHVLGSGMTAVVCEKGFDKAVQTVTVAGLETCLPDTVTPQGMRYCSDQDQVVLDATVAHLSIELVLAKTDCPAQLVQLMGTAPRQALAQLSPQALLQPNPKEQQEQIVATGAHLMRRDH
mmetsp:Transcript_14615/g.25887  ORF Transcript_14615/g.25887 Transcript_14615/m.25887 type:complete len:206 (-) Transcript_14615:95-712(-)